MAEVAQYVNGLAALLLLLPLSVWIWRRAGKRLAPRALAAWLFGWGLLDALALLASETGWWGAPSFDWSIITLALIPTTAALVLVIATPRHFGATGWTRAAMVWLAIGLAIPLARTFWLIDYFGADATTAVSMLIYPTSLDIPLAALLAYPSIKGWDARGRSHAFVIALILSVWTLMGYGTTLSRASLYGHSADIMTAYMLEAGVFSVLILARQLHRPWGAGFRQMAGVLAVLLLGQVFAVFSWGTTAAGYGNVVWAVLTAAGLTYAMLHDDVLRLDIGLKWTIHRGFLPGLAVATFFIISEGAQEFFGARTGSAYLGIAAAGLLLVGIGPIQSAAQRLADHAVPGVPTVRPFLSPTEIYRHATRAAMVDGELTPAEEAELAILQDRLGLSATESVRLRTEVAASLPR